MKRPPNLDLPFFAYGTFRPGQLAFFQLRDLVRHVEQPVEVIGSLLIRDGLPILDRTAGGRVQGVLLSFHPDRVDEAYGLVSAMEPDSQYRWDEVRVNGAPANLLVGKSPNKGSEPCEEAEWDGWNDPLFTGALEVVAETLTTSETFDWNLKPMFRLQMAYLLLWSSIERYLSLRYPMVDDSVMSRVRQLATEPAFAVSLRNHVRDRREVYRTDRPGEKEVLDPRSPEKAILYYYQVRCNITHRGKGVVRDHETLRDCAAELLAIFQEVLKVAQEDARRSFPSNDST